MFCFLLESLASQQCEWQPSVWLQVLQQSGAALCAGQVTPHAASELLITMQPRTAPPVTARTVAGQAELESAERLRGAPRTSQLNSWYSGEEPELEPPRLCFFFLAALASPSSSLERLRGFLLGFLPPRADFLRAAMSALRRGSRTCEIVPKVRNRFCTEVLGKGRGFQQSNGEFPYVAIRSTGTTWFPAKPKTSTTHS